MHRGSRRRRPCSRASSRRSTGRAAGSETTPSSSRGQRSRRARRAGRAICFIEAVEVALRAAAHHRRRGRPHGRRRSARHRLRPRLRRDRAPRPPAPAAGRLGAPAGGRSRVDPRTTDRARARRASSSTSARRPRRSRPTGPPRAAHAVAGCGVLVNLGGDIAIARAGAGRWLDRARDRRPRARGPTRRSDDPRCRRRAGDLEHHRAALGDRRRPPAPHRGPRDGRSARPSLADGERRRGLVRRREHRQHRRDRPRRGRGRLARRSSACRRGSSRTMRRGHRGWASWPEPPRMTLAARERADRVLVRDPRRRDRRAACC